MTLKEIRRELIFPPLTQTVCHASTHCRTHGGVLLAAWFQGSKEGASDTAIWYARCLDGDWQKPDRLGHKRSEAHWNPVLHCTKDGAVILYYKEGNSIQNWRTLFRVSRDAGKSWSDEAELVVGDCGGRGPVRTKPLVLADGTLIAGSSKEGERWRTCAEVSRDGGYTWTAGEELDLFLEKDAPFHTHIPVSPQSLGARGIIQPALWESKPGSVHMLLRSTEGVLYRSDSADSGRSWSKPYPTDIPNNNSGIDIADLGSLLVLASNPVGKNWAERSPLSLSISYDRGTSWTQEILVESGAGEYSYPALTADTHRLCLSYTHNRTSIAYCEYILEETK